MCISNGVIWGMENKNLTGLPAVIGGAIRKYYKGHARCNVPSNSERGGFRMYPLDCYHIIGQNRTLYRYWVTEIVPVVSHIRDCREGRLALYHGCTAKRKKA